ncbi:MAG: hypothetical protein JWP20_1292 [Roseomonas sp.]|jgi:DUF1009 family protein|nr:hypothetical protein [Roseomonas sp.]
MTTRRKRAEPVAVAAGLLARVGLTEPLGGPLGIIAGGGLLPQRAAASAAAAGRPVHVVVLDGFAAAPDYAAYPHIVCRLGAAGRMLDWLRAARVQDLILAGRVSRPSFLSLRPDAGAARLMPRVGLKAFGGDDSLLSAVVRVLREEGFNPLEARQVLAEVMIDTPGVLTSTYPDEQALGDIRRGLSVVRALGSADVGQGAVVQQGLVLAVEAIEGTDAMLIRAGGLRRDGPGGVFVKVMKPGQDRRVDLPTIGPDTVAAAATAGLRGIAIQAGGTVVIDRAATLAAAEAAGMFLLALDPSAPEWAETPG